MYFPKIYDIFISLQVATAGILKFCMRELLGKRQQDSLFTFSDAVSDVCSDKQAVGTCSVNLEDKLNHACALMERDWPVSLQVRVKHKRLEYPSQSTPNVT